jgi:hypothetical protein
MVLADHFFRDALGVGHCGYFSGASPTPAGFAKSTRPSLESHPPLCIIASNQTPAALTVTPQFGREHEAL